MQASRSTPKENTVSIGPTVIGTTVIDGDSCLVVAAGEDAVNLKFVTVPMSASHENLKAAFVDACEQLGFSGEKPEETSVEGSVDPTTYPVPEEPVADETPVDAVPASADELSEEELEAATAPETVPVDENTHVEPVTEA